jgi:hypothetical protein
LVAIGGTRLAIVAAQLWSGFADFLLLLEGAEAWDFGV